MRAVGRPAITVVPPTPAHYFAADTTFRRRLKNTDLGAAPSRRHFETGRVRFQLSKKSVRSPALEGMRDGRTTTGGAARAKPEAASPAGVARTLDSALE